MYGRQLNLPVDDLAVGINILYGPNGSGKTTIARGLESVLWPSVAAKDGRIIEASMVIDGVSWSATLDRGRTIWRKDGRETDAPAFPAADQRDRYQLLLPELIASEDQSFARLVLREMVGGVDVRAAADSLKFKMPSPRRSMATEAAEERARDVAAVMARQNELRGDRERLRELRIGLDEARKARRTVDYLNVLVAALEARDERLSAERRLEGYSDRLEHMHGDEVERLSQLREKRDDCSRQLRKAQDDIEQHLGVLNDSILADGAIDDGILVELDARVQRIGEAETGVRAAAGSLREAEADETAAWDRIGIGVDRDRAAELDLPGFEELSGVVRRKRAAEARSDARRQLIELIGEPSTDDSTDELRDAARLLFRWMKTMSKAGGVSSVVRVLLLVAGLMHIIVGVVTGIAWSPYGYLLVVAGIGAAWLAWKLPVRSGDSIAEEHRSSFERTGIDGPVTWTPDEVWTVLEDLQRRIADARWSDLVREHRRRVQNAGESEEDIASLAEARESLIDRTGLDPQLSDEGLTYTVGRILDWQKAVRRAEGDREKLEHAREELDEALDRFHETVASYGEKRPEDAAQAASAVSRLRSASVSWREAASALKSARNDVARLTGDIEQFDASIRALFEKAGLDLGADSELADLCRDKTAYDEARDALREAVGAEKSRFDTVQKHSEFEVTDRDRSVKDVESEIESLSETADREEKLRESIRSIEQEVARTEKGHDLEIARSELDEALAVLDRERIDHFRTLAGAMLADFVSDQTHERQLPSVFKRARAIFSDVTGGQYELRLGDAAFTAFDTVIETEHELGELSTGTRVQLLLSVRIAFIEEQERGVRLPIILDETLANSDDARADAIVRTILRICRGGRQVFYLTARDDEVAQWKRVVDTMDDVEFRLVMLDETRLPALFPADGVGGVNGLPPAISRDVPSPAGVSHAEYGRILDVEPWNPYAPTGATHLWYLIEDTGLLHRLLAAGYERWGPLSALIRDGDPSVTGLSPDRINDITLRAAAVDAWKRAWSIGRGKPVDAYVLERSGAVSDKFLDEVSALAKEVSFDGASIVNRLRQGAVSGFYSSKMDELERWLIENGYIDESGALDPNEIWTHTVRSVSERMAKSGMSIDELKGLIGRVAGAELTPSRTEAPSGG